MGGAEAKAPQHSQSLQSLMAHILGLVVVMPADRHSIIESYRFAFQEYRRPVVILEHRLLYEFNFEDDTKELSHTDKNMTCENVKKTGNMPVVDTYWGEYGVVAEMNRLINEYDLSILNAPTKSMGILSVPCRTAKVLEDMCYPEVHDICNTVNKIVKGDNLFINLPKNNP